MAAETPAEWLEQMSVSRVGPIVDSHVHMGSISEEESMQSIRVATGIERMALVSIQDPAKGTGLPQSLYMKARYPNRFYVFAGLNHAARMSGGKVSAPGLIEQLEAFVHCGCDGLKMLEGKPTSRQQLNVPVIDAYYDDYWSRVEELGIPIVWHVNDPEEFWDPQRIPRWAAEHNWGYGPNDVQKETLYAEVVEVLRRHTRLRVSFAHFYFLSADLPRAARFLEEHPTVCFDLAPGIEMLYNISRDVDAGRSFFVKYADRIVYGTDLFSSLTLAEARARAGLVLRWLATGDTFRVPPEADFLLGPPEDGIIHGLSLPREVLQRILRGNFERLTGTTPKPLNTSMAIELCERIAVTAEALGGPKRDQTEAAKVAKKLAKSA
jgi:predicted TIM-barrel fold metal-dependent hydrolase